MNENNSEYTRHMYALDIAHFCQGKVFQKAMVELGEHCYMDFVDTVGLKLKIYIY